MLAGFITFLLVSASAFLVTSQIEGLLRNGNFEEKPRPENLNKTVLKGKDALPEWTTTGFVEYITAGPQENGMYFAAAHGDHAVRLGNEASIEQRIRVKQGSLYALTFGASRTCAQDEVLNVTVPPQTGELPLQTLYASNGGDTYAWGFRPERSGFVDVIFHNPGVQEDPACGPLIDAVAIKELFPPKYSIGNLVKNSGFEVGPHLLLNTSNGVLLPPKQQDFASPLPGWIVSSLKAVKFIDSDHFNVPTGRAALELLAGRESAVSQVIRTVKGKKYTLEFTVGDARNGCRGSMVVEAFAANEVLRVPFVSHGRGAFKTANFQFTALSQRTIISFQSSFYHTMHHDMVSLCGPVIDEVKVYHVAH